MGNETSILRDDVAMVTANPASVGKSLKTPDSPINRLPNEILIEIFKYLYDAKSRETSHYSTFMLYWCSTMLLNRNSRYDHVLRELRLVCGHWNALVLGSLKLFRYVRLRIRISESRITFSTLYNRTTTYSSQRFISDHLQYLHDRVKVQVNFILHDQTVTTEHARQISEALSFIPNILSFQFSCDKLHAANVVDIKKLFDCFSRPDTVGNIDFSVEQWTPELHDAIASFVTKHRHLDYIRLSFSEPGCFEQHKKLTYSTLQEWEDTRSFVTINGIPLKNVIRDDDFSPGRRGNWPCIF